MNPTYFLPDWRTIATTPESAKPFDFAALKKAGDQLAAIPKPPRQEFVCRKIPEDWSIELSDGRSSGSLFGIKVRICKSIPATVKDKDGNEVELIGMLVGEMTVADLGAFTRPIQMITGKVVKAAVKNGQ